MSKIINTELLDQLGRPKEIVDGMLDRQIENLETRLGLRAKGVGNRVLGMFLANGTRVQLSESQIYGELHRQVGLGSETTTEVIKDLSDAGILRITSGGRYEIANSFLARRANQKVEAENRVLRTIKATVQDRMTRDELLDQPYLNYIATSLPLLDLPEEEKAFVERSREAVQKRKRRFNWFMLLAFIVLAAVAFNTYLIYRGAESNNEKLIQANQELNDAREQEIKLREEAQEALRQAQDAQEAAEAARQEAVTAQQSAERNASEARRQRVIAESLRQEAVQDRNRIQAQANRLKELTEQAQLEAQRNLALRDQAETSEALAQNALNRAEVLNRIITSWNAASRALQIEDARTKTLVTLEAYKLNRDNPDMGDVYHPTLVKALLDAATSLDENLKYGLPAAHQGAIRDIVVHPDVEQLYTAGSDGKIQRWTIDSWNSLGVPELGKPRDISVQTNVVYNQLSLHPNGKQILAVGESLGFNLFKIPGGQSTDVIAINPPEEIFASGITASGDFLAAGFDHFYRYTAKGKQLERLPKSHSNKCFVIESDQNLSIFSVQGAYQEYAYALSIDSLGEGAVGRQEINFYGTPKEVDYGPVAKVDYRQLNDNVGILVIGFSSGRLMIIETDAKGDRFLPRNGDARKDFKPHQAAIADVAFSQDGKKLAIASLDGTVSLWDLEHYAEPSYQPIILDRHPGWVMSVAFARNGEYLISGCQDGSLYFWNIEPDNYASFLCEKLEETGGSALQEQRKLESISRKSGLTRAFDQLSYEDYRKYFGEAQSQRFIRLIRVCN